MFIQYWIVIAEYSYFQVVLLNLFAITIVIVTEWEKRATNFILGIILHLQMVIQMNIIYFCLGKRDTGSGPLYP